MSERNTNMQNTSMNSRTKPIFAILLCGLYFSFPVFAEEQKPVEQAAVLEADLE